jgi:hypothetical protein
MAAITCYAPQVRSTCFALPGVVSHLQAVHVSQGVQPSTPSLRADGVAIPLLTKLMSPYPVVFPPGDLFRSVYHPPPFPLPAGLFLKFNRVWRKGLGGREVACSRSLTGPLAFVRSSMQGSCSRSLTVLYMLLRTPRKEHIRINRAVWSYLLRFRRPSQHARTCHLRVRVS